MPRCRATSSRSASSKQPKGDDVTRFDRPELIRRQIAAGLTMEDMELILSPMVEGAKEAIGSMGDDTPLAVVSLNARTISHFFRQNFSQVTNPPIDSLRERQVMSLKTRFSNLSNILDVSPTPAPVLVLDSPVLTTADWRKLRAHFGDKIGRDRLHLRRRRHARGPARRDPAHPQRSRSRRPPGQERTLPDRRSRRARARRDRRRARRRRGPHPPRPPRPAQLRERQHPHRRMPRPALLRGADRGRRDHRERLARRSRHRRPPGARAVRRPQPRRLPRPPPQGDRRRAAQDHRQDGDRGDLQLSRRL